jgi:hypothetical protein
MVTRFGVLLGVSLGISLSLGCGHHPWPDEPGIPVDLVRADNVEAGDTFLASLTNRRRSASLAEPIIAPRYQGEIRTFAEDLQSGKTSVAEAERAIGAWARTTYGREVKTFALECASGSAMRLPDALVEMPFVVISFAAAHFRPRSVPGTQCAVLAAALVGSEPVAGTQF